MSATATMKKTKEIDEKFQIAIDVLSVYEGEHHPYIIMSGVAKMMEAARVKDNSSLTNWKRVEESLSVTVSEEFHLRFLAY